MHVAPVLLGSIPKAAPSTLLGVSAIRVTLILCLCKVQSHMLCLSLFFKKRWAGGGQSFTPWPRKPLSKLSLSVRCLVPSSPLNNKPCLLLWKFRFILLLFLHINSELNSCFSPSAFSHVWSLSFAQKSYYFSCSPISQGDQYYLETSIPLPCSCLHISRDPGQTHN